MFIFLMNIFASICAHWGAPKRTKKKTMDYLDEQIAICDACCEYYLILLTPFIVICCLMGLIVTGLTHDAKVGLYNNWLA